MPERKIFKSNISKKLKHVLDQIHLNRTVTLKIRIYAECNIKITLK